MAEVIKQANDLHNTPDKEIEIYMQSASDCVDALKDDGWHEGDLETNGWQWDYNIKFVKKGKIIVLSGSGYHGRSITMSNANE